MDIPTSSISIFFFDEAFEYGGGTNFWVYVGVNANHYV
jgi:hypothetical protein